MIYEPRLAVDLFAIIGQGVIHALVLALGDFIAQENKMWAYYVGAALGYTAAATGIVNAAATLYVIGTTLDVTLLHSEDGSDVKIFLNGVLYSSLDTYAAGGATWQTATIALVAAVWNRIDIVNGASTNGDKTSTINWLGIGSIFTDGQIRRPQSMAYDTIAFRMLDVEGGRKSTFPVRIPSGDTLADIQTYVDFFAPLLDDTSGSQLTAVEVTMALNLPAGLKANPVAGTYNERGGLITFDTSGMRADSVFIPGILATIASGEGEFSLADAAIAALIVALTTPEAGTAIRPRTTHDYQFVTARKGARTFRK